MGCHHYLSLIGGAIIFRLLSTCLWFAVDGSSGMVFVVYRNAVQRGIFATDGALWGRVLASRTSSTELLAHSSLGLF